MEEDRRKKRSRLLKNRRKQHVARFKSELLRRIEANEHVFEDGLSENINLLRQCSSIPDAGSPSQPTCTSSSSSSSSSSTSYAGTPSWCRNSYHPSRLSTSGEGWQGAETEYRWRFDKVSAKEEHERRRNNFHRSLDQQMQSLERRAEEMRRELDDARGYAPFCHSCQRPIITPCDCPHPEASHPTVIHIEWS